MWIVTVLSPRPIRQVLEGDHGGEVLRHLGGAALLRRAELGASDDDRGMELWRVVRALALVGVGWHHPPPLLAQVVELEFKHPAARRIQLQDWDGQAKMGSIGWVGRWKRSVSSPALTISSLDSGVACIHWMR